MATLLSNPASPPAAQSEQAELKVLWEDEMKAVNKYVHYKNVFALLLFWENKPGWTDMSTEKEVCHQTSVRLQSDKNTNLSRSIGLKIFFEMSTSFKYKSRCFAKLESTCKRK